MDNEAWYAQALDVSGSIVYRRAMMTRPPRVPLLVALALPLAALIVGVGVDVGVTHAFTPRLLRPDSIVRQVATAYGDAHPRIVRVVSDVTDPPPHHAMYTITVTGYFRSGHQRARYLVISALADKAFVFGINAYERLGQTHPVWFDPGQAR